MAAFFLSAGRASAAVITPTDLEFWTSSGSKGSPVPGFPPTADTFDNAPPTPGFVGLLVNFVYFNDATLEYTYEHWVVPTEDSAAFFNTGFDVPGFTGTAGWQFDDSIAAGGCGGPSPTCNPAPFDEIGDFIIQGEVGSGSSLNWAAFGTLVDDGWDAGDLVRFFYVSTKGPREGGNYNLTAGPTGTGQSYAPTPEPGSMLLLGSGLATLYGAARRRRSQKNGSTAEIA
jgi:hypothetical protein